MVVKHLNRNGHIAPFFFLFGPTQIQESTKYFKGVKKIFFGGRVWGDSPSSQCQSYYKVILKYEEKHFFGGREWGDFPSSQCQLYYKGILKYEEKQEVESMRMIIIIVGGWVRNR